MGHARGHVEPAWASTRARGAAAEEDAERQAPVSAPRFLGAGLRSGVRPSPLDHPTARLLGAAAVLGAQRTHGNAHVARLLVQRTDAAAGSDDVQQRLGAIRTVMEASATGRDGLAVLDKYRVKIVFDAAGWAQYDPATNTITLEAKATDVRAALTLVHELHHARCEKEGIGADATKLSREEYVKQMVEEEAEGAVKSIEAKIELEGTEIDVSKASFPQEKEYRKAYKKAIKEAKAKDRTIPENDLKKVGREAGKARVIQGFMDGDVVTDTTGQTYPEYYGKDWDRFHPSTP